MRKTLVTMTLLILVLGPAAIAQTGNRSANPTSEKQGPWPAPVGHRQPRVDEVPPEDSAWSMWRNCFGFTAEASQAGVDLLQLVVGGELRHRRGCVGLGHDGYRLSPSWSPDGRRPRCPPVRGVAEAAAALGFASAPLLPLDPHHGVEPEEDDVEGGGDDVAQGPAGNLMGRVLRRICPPGDRAWSRPRSATREARRRRPAGTGRTRPGRRASTGPSSGQLRFGPLDQPLEGDEGEGGEEQRDKEAPRLLGQVPESEGVSQ